MATENKALFNIGKAGAISEASIKGYQAAVNSYEFGSRIGGPALGAAFAAASAAATAAQISKIASTSYGSRGGGSAGAGGAAPAAQAQQQAPLDVRVTGTGFVAVQDIPSLFDGLQDEARDRGLRFV